MRHELHIRFGQPPRAVRSIDPAAVPPPGRPPTDDAAARALAEKQLADQEHRALEAVLADLAEVAESLKATRNELLGEMQQVAVELATAIAMRVTYDKLQSDRFAIEELVQDVAGRLGPAERVLVRLHPDDLALLQRRLGAAGMVAPAEFQLVPDAALGRGDCVADAGDVSYEACLEDQLDGIRQHLLRNLTDAQVERRKTQAGDRQLRRFPDRRQTA